MRARVRVRVRVCVCARACASVCVCVWIHVTYLYILCVGTLEEVSEKTMEVNKATEISLEEISKTVEPINNIIKEKKGKLAPLIKELRQVRTDFSQPESEYNEKKSLYESTAAGLDTERDRLHAEVTAYQDECKREESRYHYLNAMIESTKLILERARLEDAGKNRVGDANQSYRELYQSRFIYICRCLRVYICE